MPLDPDKIQEALDSLDSFMVKAGELSDLLIRIRNATIKDKDGNIIVQPTSGQKNALVSEYEKRKTALQEAMTDLP